jgi:hypothetical protein
MVGGDGGELFYGERLPARPGRHPPAACRTATAASAPPIQPTSAARSVFRCCAKAASTAAKAASRPARVQGGSRGANANRPDSTLDANTTRQQDSCNVDTNTEINQPVLTYA